MHSWAQERRHAAYALGERRDVRAIPHLLEAIQDSDKRMKAGVAEALGKIGHESAVPAIAELLRHEDSGVRLYAAGALGEIGHESVIPHLVKAIEDEDRFVRSNAAKGLEKIYEAAKEKGVETKEGKALLLVWPYLHKEAEPKIIRQAYLEALKGKVTKENVRLYVKQLHALEGKLK